MSQQKSIMSFFSKGASAKPKEKAKAKEDEKENEPKPLNGQDEKIDETNAKKGSCDDDESKENSSNHRNVDNEKKQEEKKEASKDGLPPLRKTAKRVVKRKSEAEEEECAKKAKKEDAMEEDENENSPKPVEQKKRTARKSMPGPTKTELAQVEKLEKLKKQQEDETKEEAEEMEVDDSPVKVTKHKKKKAVIESDSDEDESDEKEAEEKDDEKKNDSDDGLGDESESDGDISMDAISAENIVETKRRRNVTEPVANNADKKSPNEKSPPTKSVKGKKSPEKEKKKSSARKENKIKEEAKTDEKTSKGKKEADDKNKVKEETKKSPPKKEIKVEEEVKTTKDDKEEPQAKNSSEKEKHSPEKKEKIHSFFDKKTATPKQKDSTKKETTGTPARTTNTFQSFFSPKAGAKERNEGGADYEVVVKKSSYHPVDDSFWKRGEKTPYLALAKTLQAIEDTSGRLKTIEILSNYFRSVMVQTPDDLLPSVYMTLNRLAPAWEGTELGIGETLLMKAIANTTGRSTAQIKTDAGKTGDLGLVAETSRGGQRTMFQPAHLTVAAVFARLKDIAALTGHSSTSKKVEKIQAMLVACRGSEARYLIRSLAGKLRIGLAEQSVLQALAQACVQTPTGQDYPPEKAIAFKSSESEAFKERLADQALKLKTAYCECPSYDLVIPALLENGVDRLHETCKLTPGIPLKPMLAHPTKGVQEVLTRFENCKFTCEWKYDGERAQLHLSEDGTMNIYSRNQEDNTTKFPDIIARFKNCLGDKVKTAVLDTEAVAWDREKKTIQPFQVLSTRKRKDAVEEEIKVQVCLFAFDLLYLNGETLVRKPFLERRQLLKENFTAVEGEFQFAKAVDGETTEQIQEALEESVKENCEGLMVKTLDVDATYEIARRSHNWLKLKKDYLDGVGDTIDLVVIGGYLGKGKRAGGYGGFLLACYEPENEEYQSICKIGTGFSDEDLVKHTAFFKDHVIEKPKSYYAYDQSHAPDHWFDVAQVWEVKCADLSISPVHRAATGIVDPAKGISLRFPRFIKIRDDKNPEDATNAEQIATMYRSQDVVKNQAKQKAASAEDDFDF